MHGFRKGHGCRTAIFQDKIWTRYQQNMGNTVFKAFIDIKAAYDMVDRDKLLHILTLNGVGTRTINVLKSYWEN